MANKQDLIQKIKDKGIQEVEGYSDEYLNKLHWTKLQQILDEDEQETQETMTETQEPTVPLSIVEQLKQEIEALRNQISNAPQVSQPIVVQTGNNEVWGTKKRVSLDNGDYEKEPTTFLKWGRGYVIASYFKDGQEKLAPYGAPIELRYTNANVRNIGGADQLVHISTYRTHSKKEKEWIRNHPLYGKGIYEKVEQVLNYNPRTSSMIESVAIGVGAMSAQDVFARANAMGVDVTSVPDIDKLKTIIIAHEAEQLLNREKQQQVGTNAKMLDDILSQEA